MRKDQVDIWQEILHGDSFIANNFAKVSYSEVVYYNQMSANIFLLDTFWNM